MPGRWLALHLVCLIAGCGDAAWITPRTTAKVPTDSRPANAAGQAAGTLRVAGYDSELATLTAAIDGALQSVSARPHEKTPGRSQVFSHPLGGPGEARAGGAHEKTPGRSQVFSHPLGGPGEARAGGVHDGLLALETVSLYVERARLTGNYDDYGRAEQLLAQTTTRLGPLSYPCLAQAQLHYTLHRLAAAGAALDACPASVAQDQIQGLRGDIAFYSGRYQEAERIYRGLVNQTGTPRQYIRLALVRNRLGSPGEAAAFLEAAEKRYHGVSATMKAWLKLQRGLLAFERGRLDEAIALYRLAADELPGWWLIDEHIAEALRLGPDPGPVQAAYEDLVRRTGLPEMMDELARVLLGGGNPVAAAPWIERAAAIYRERMQLFPEASAGHAVDHFLQFGSAQEALALAQRSVKMRPYGEALIALATAQLRAGQAAQAATTIAQVQASGWNTADLHAVAAQVHAGLGNSVDAAAARARALAMNPHAVRLYAIAMPEPAPRR